MIEYRKMLKSDIAAGLALCRAAGWNQLENDWNMFLDLAPECARVAIDEEGKVVGTVTTINYEDRFSWIGMVLVDPGKKRQGIGTQLLREALNILQNLDTVKLDATPAGREVYVKLGFVDEYILSRMVLTEEAEPLPGDGRNVSAEHFDYILEQDKNVFGASRENLLKRMFKNYPELSFTINNNSYSFARKGFNFTQIGPVIAERIDDAKQLLISALNNVKGPVVIDVMDNSPFQQWLRSRGFTEQRKLIRMYHGKNSYPGIPAKQFAILGPEFG
jgi:GNAT superfamily N-acetyltransferase